MFKVSRRDALRSLANLETDAHPQMLEADMRRNLTYVRTIMRQA